MWIKGLSFVTLCFSVCVTYGELIVGALDARSRVPRSSPQGSLYYVLRQENLLSQGLSPPTSIRDQARGQDDRLDIDILSRSIKTQKKNEADIRSS